MADSPSRLTAEQIYNLVVADGRSELSRPASALAFSGLASGLFMGLTGLGVAGAKAELGGHAGTSFVALLLYPLGFLVVVIGRAQLFTENTLYPVVLVLEDRTHLLLTLRLWALVFAGNILGALAFAGLATSTGALPPAAVAELRHLGVTAVDPALGHVFTSAIFGGWLVALMAWIVAGTQRTIGQVAVIWLVTLPVGLLHLAHCIASSSYILVAMFAGDVTAGDYLTWLTMATAGNILGGVGIVTLLNYGQVRLGSQNSRTDIKPSHPAGQ